MKPLTVHYELDETGVWIASIPSVKGCHSHGRSLSQARQRIREALWAATDDETMAYSVELVDDIRVPAEARRVLAELEKAREHADEAKAEVRRTAARVVRMLTDKMHLSRRDAAELTGYSFQRIHQLVRREDGRG